MSTITDEFGQDQVVEDENLLKRLKQTIRNQFNYSQRECQTINNTVRTKGISTCPPSSKNVKSEINQWKIFDAYQAEFAREAEEEAAENEEDRATMQCVSIRVDGMQPLGNLRRHVDLHPMAVPNPSAPRDVGTLRIAARYHVEHPKIVERRSNHEATIHILATAAREE